MLSWLEDVGGLPHIRYIVAKQDYQTDSNTLYCVQNYFTVLVMLKYRLDNKLGYCYLNVAKFVIVQLACYLLHIMYA